MQNRAALPHVLVVDDDARLRDLLLRFLTENNFVVATAENASQARHLLAHLQFDVMVLDVMMPGETGVQLTKNLRQTSQIPILLLTAQGNQDDRIEGLEAGADDYLPKPFEPRELVLRLHAILRRTPQVSAGGGSHNKRLKFGAVEFDAAKRELWHGSTQVRLTEAETKLLALLAARPGDVLTRETLLAHDLVDGTDRAVDVLITRLRRKLEADPRQPRYLQTVRGEGYRLIADG